MLIVMIWLGGLFPPKHNSVIDHCQQDPRNQCVLLGENDWQYYIQKDRHMLNISDERIKSMLVVERSDILRLLYLYEHGGAYSDLDNQIDYSCLYNFVANRKESFFAQEQRQPNYPSNNFIYAPKPHDPQIERVIRSVKQCDTCWGLDLASPWFMRTIPINYTKIQCVNHLYQSSWWWWTSENKHIFSSNTAKEYRICLENQKECRQSQYCGGQESLDCDHLKSKDLKQLQMCETNLNSSSLLLSFYQPSSQICSEELEISLKNPIEPQYPCKNDLPTKEETNLFKSISIFFLTVSLGALVSLKVHKEKEQKGIKINQTQSAEIEGEI